MGNASRSESRGSGFDKSTKIVRSSKADPEVVSGAGRASPAELLQFNLSQPVASVIIGCEQMAPLEQNVQAAMNFTPISESVKQKLQEKVAPSRSAWENFLQTHEDSVAV
jgi:aryl-alcohol dehydrogenase-like predicted oxidoreductase